MNQLLRIGQETITNALQHGGASEVSIAVRFGKADVTLEVSDNGKGFDVEEVHSVESGHFGITGMKERAKHINAALEISSRKGGGTTVKVFAPAGDASGSRRPAWRKDKEGAFSENVRSVE